MGKYFGVMLDMSRNGVMKLDSLKQYIDYLSAFGYNMIQLYTEDTYEVENEAYFGYLRGAYKQSELKEIDEYCQKKGIELIPCVQTLAHLQSIFRWDRYKNIHDTADILLVDDDQTYAFIDNIFFTLSKTFSSRKVNIGMDEAHMVGLGKYLDRHGYQNRYALLNRHLNRVVEIAKKYGFEPLMWSDMFYRLHNNGEYYTLNPKLPETISQDIPDVTPVFWDYYHAHKKYYLAMLQSHKKFKRELWFAGGAWSWIGFTPSNRFTLRTMRPALDACREMGVENVMFTLWGDNGKECSYFALLPSLYYLRRYYDGERNRHKIADEFEKITGESFERMMRLDMPNYVGKKPTGNQNPSKYMLYNDLFFGVFDTLTEDGIGEEYARLAKRFALYAKQSKSFGYLYDMQAKLCKTLSTKYGLGVALRSAYQSRDKEKLHALVPVIKNTEKSIGVFYESFRKLWYLENKPQGFEVQDARLGGLERRVRSCRLRVEAYLNGEIDELPELTEKLLDFWGNGEIFGKEIVQYNRWSDIITTNNID